MDVELELVLVLVFVVAVSVGDRRREPEVAKAPGTEVEAATEGAAAGRGEVYSNPSSLTFG